MAGGGRDGPNRLRRDERRDPQRRASGPPTPLRAVLVEVGGGSSGCCAASRAEHPNADPARRRLLGRRLQPALRDSARRRAACSASRSTRGRRRGRSAGAGGGSGRPRNGPAALARRQRRRRRLQPGAGAPEEHLAADDRDAPGAAGRRPRGPLGAEPGQPPQPGAAGAGPPADLDPRLRPARARLRPSASSASWSPATAPTRSSARISVGFYPLPTPWSAPLARLWPAAGHTTIVLARKTEAEPPWLDYIGDEVEGGMQTFYAE